MQWRDVEQPTTKEERMTLAKRTRKELGITITIAVTELANTVHKGLGGLPNSAILVGKGRKVLYKEAWANPVAWPPLFDRLLTHMDEHNGEQLELGVAERSSPRGGRGVVPARTHVPKTDDATEEGDGAESSEGDGTEGSAEGDTDEKPEGDSGSDEPGAGAETPDEPEVPDAPGGGTEDFR